MDDGVYLCIFYLFFFIIVLDVAIELAEEVLLSEMLYADVVVLMCEWLRNMF